MGSRKNTLIQLIVCAVIAVAANLVVSRLWNHAVMRVIGMAAAVIAVTTLLTFIMSLLKPASHRKPW